jgi:hypothetical protein
MKIHKSTAFKFAICVENKEYPASLEIHKLYQVIPDADAAMDGDIRIIDESGEDYLYPADYFVQVEIPREAAKSINSSFHRRAQHAASQRASAG